MLSPSDTGPGFAPLPTFPADSIVTYGKKILVALPWHKSAHPITAFCVAQLMDRRRTASMLSHGDAFIAHTRNVCVDIFLKSQCEWLLMIDDDMVVPFGDAACFKQYTGFNFPDKFMRLNAIDRLMAAGKPLVGALYFGRHPNAHPVFNEGADPATAVHCRKGPHEEVRATKWVGTGCMLINRSVFEAIERKFPRLARQNGQGGNWFTSTEASLMQRLTKLHADMSSVKMTERTAYTTYEEINNILVQAHSENSLGFGEDVSFCHRALASGFTPYVDLGLICGHIGTCVYGPQNTGLK